MCFMLHDFCRGVMYFELMPWILNWHGHVKYDRVCLVVWKCIWCHSLREWIWSRTDTSGTIVGSNSLYPIICQVTATHLKIVNQWIGATWQAWQGTMIAAPVIATRWNDIFMVINSQNPKRVIQALLVINVNWLFRGSFYWHGLIGTGKRDK